MRRILLVLLLVQLWWGRLDAQAPLPPAPQQWVTDGEAFLSPAVQARLNKRLANYQRATGHQVLVYIGGSTAGEPLENWTVKAFESWKVGRKGMDDGAVLFILAKDQKVRLEVGYGLEGTLPDAVASRLIRETILPRLKTRDRDGAVTAGTSELLRTLGGEVDAPPRDRPSGGKAPIGVGTYVVFGILAAGFMAMLIINPALAMGLLFSLMSGGRGGGGGGGRDGDDDGFSGGGGRSGGGGASGSW